MINAETHKWSQLVTDETDFECSAPNGTGVSILTAIPGLREHHRIWAEEMS